MRGSIPSSLCYRIYDYVDRQVPMLTRMFEKRLVTFRAIGYVPDSVALKFEEPREERTVEYDEDADRNARGSEALARLDCGQFNSGFRNRIAEMRHRFTASLDIELHS